jgi:phospholipase C
MEQRPGPIIRPASTRRRRPTRKQIAQRRGFAVLCVVLVTFLIWQFWPSGGTSPSGGTAPTDAASDPTDSASPTNPGTVVPGENPIEHVIFLIKENRTFDHYFGSYPGAEGVTVGQTMKRDAGGEWVDGGKEVELVQAPYIQPHDITHGFASGLYAINGGEMNGYNIIGEGEDLSGYTQHSRDSLPSYWALADRFVLADMFFTSMYGP